MLLAGTCTYEFDSVGLGRLTGACDFTGQTVDAVPSQACDCLSSMPCTASCSRELLWSCLRLMEETEWGSHAFGRLENLVSCLLGRDLYTAPESQIQEDTRRDEVWGGGAVQCEGL